MLHTTTWEEIVVDVNKVLSELKTLLRARLSQNRTLLEKQQQPGAWTKWSYIFTSQWSFTGCNQKAKKSSQKMVRQSVSNDIKINIGQENRFKKTYKISKKTWLFILCSSASIWHGRTWLTSQFCSRFHKGSNRYEPYE